MAKTYRLPDGKDTENADEYIKSWRELAKPIEKATGYKLYGFNPGFSFSNGREVIDISCEFVKKLKEALE